MTYKKTELIQIKTAALMSKYYSESAKQVRRTIAFPFLRVQKRHRAFKSISPQNDPGVLDQYNAVETNTDLRLYRLIRSLPESLACAKRTQKDSSAF